MRKASIVIGALLVASLTPSAAFAWGLVGHRYIMRRAIELLPPELKPFFEKYREEVVVRVMDPDTWRQAGWDDNPNHFLDFGVREYGVFPFAELPREYGAAIEKFGMATLNRNGTLPWREQEEFGNLRRAFESLARANVYASSDLVLFTGVLSHYIQDAHQPLHATINYDGQLTGNPGVHARFERDLIERYLSRMTISPAPPRAVTNARDFAFDTLLASFQLVDALNKADEDALGSKDTYDDEYFERFFTAVRPMLEQRLAASITATASLIIGAWEQAGRPALKLEDPRPVERARRP